MAVAHISEDEQALIEAIRELARERVAPRAAEIDHTGEFPWDMQQLLAQQDILAMPFPTEYGGIGASELAVVMAIEELSRCCATTGLLLAVAVLGTMPIMLAGTDEQKRKYIPKVASGEWLAAFGLTEAGSGSDAAAMRTFAVRKGDKYILNGSKAFHHQWWVGAGQLRLRADRPGEWDTRHQRLHCREGFSRLLRGPYRREDGHQGVADGGTDLHRL